MSWWKRAARTTLSSRRSAASSMMVSRNERTTWAKWGHYIGACTPIRPGVNEVKLSSCKKLNYDGCHVVQVHAQYEVSSRHIFHNEKPEVKSKLPQAMINYGLIHVYNYTNQAVKWRLYSVTARSGSPQIIHRAQQVVFNNSCQLQLQRTLITIHAPHWLHHR